MAAFELKCTFAALPKTTRGKPIVLGGDRKHGKNILYCNGNNVYIRDIKDAAKCDIYSDHAVHATTAQYSPTGFYICSGDVSGKIRIWDTVNVEHILKNEFHVLGGTVKDVAWDSESQKVAVVGDGREFYAKYIQFDTGTSVGELSGHNKAVNSVAIKPTRPYCMVTASEDMRLQFLKGRPLKCTETLMEHTNFVNCVRYSPNGEVFITGGADGKALIYDGSEGKHLHSLGGEKAHGGGIYGLDFNADGSEVLTVSADKTAKIWNVNTHELLVTFQMGQDLMDMQVGCLWQGDNIITVSLSGYINYLDRNNPNSPMRIQKGHSKAITTMVAIPDKSRVYTGDFDGKINSWDVNTGECEIIKGKGHSNKVSEIKIAGDWLISISMDDTVKYTSISRNEYDSNSLKLPSQPNAIAALPSGVAVITCINHIVVVDQGNLMFQQEVKFEPFCVDIHADGTTVAIGGKYDMHIFNLADSTLKHVKKIETNDDMMCVKFSPDGALLARVTGSKRLVGVYIVAEGYKEIYQATKQTGKIFSLEWSPDSRYFATGSLDGSIVVWCTDPPKYDKRVTVLIKDAHKKAYIQSLVWLSDNELISAGNDCCLKQWKLRFA